MRYSIVLRSSMKMEKILILIILFGLQYSKAQIYTNDDVAHHRIKINNTITLFTPLQEIKRKLGSPLRITKTYDEILDKNLLTFHYDGLTLYFFNNKLENYVITGNKHPLYIDNFCVKIGMSIKKLAKKFPKSFKNRDNDGMGIEVTKMDYAIIIYNDKNGIINKIGLFIPS